MERKIIGKGKYYIIVEEENRFSPNGKIYKVIDKQTNEKAFCSFNEEKAMAVLIKWEKELK